MPMAVAERYARALAEVAGPQGDYARLAEELKSFAAVYAASAELREVFESPAVSRDQKSGVLNAIIKRLECSDVIGRFLRVLLAHYRLNLLEEILLAFRGHVYEQIGVIPMKVASASPLSEDQKAAISKRFSGLTGKNVTPEYSIDPDLLGGVKTQIRSTVYDGTVRGVLDRIREQARAK